MTKNDYNELLLYWISYIGKTDKLLDGKWNSFEMFNVFSIFSEIESCQQNVKQKLNYTVTALKLLT